MRPTAHAGKQITQRQRQASLQEYQGYTQDASPVEYSDLFPSGHGFGAEAADGDHPALL